MKTNLLSTIAAVSAAAIMTGCQPAGRDNNFTVSQINDTTSVVRIENAPKYLLLPIQEDQDEAQVMLDGVPMDVRLAVDHVDYMVPFPLHKGAALDSVVIHNLPGKALAWQEMELADTFDTTNREIFRPVYHHSPQYGWMNDANGLVFKDGEYHLYFQYNPYGSMWGNMHWGHSVSKDLIHWQHLEPALARDTMGHIFSGSCVVDNANTAGTGQDNIIAFYTSHKSLGNGNQRQFQCMAYSSDNGRTFTKYDGNPVLTPFDGLQDFRDPKVFWYEPQQKWVMIVSADKNMRFYSSKDLKQWQYMSQFGEGYGPQPNQFECPDFVQLPVDGDKTKRKWVMIVNINPGFVYGGSGTMYFVGDFDGTRFTCDTKPDNVKWLDWGKDHYATVCFSNTGDRTIAVPWMSNWQYANYVPSKQYRAANALPRELALQTGADGQLYVTANPAKETEKLRKETRNLGNFSLGQKTFDNLYSNPDGAFELDFEVSAENGAQAGVELLNEYGRKVSVYFDAAQNTIVMDRSKSGISDFGRMVQPHEIETSASRRACVQGLKNYKNDFALATPAPLEKKTSHSVRIFADRSSIELFVDGGRVAMTNLVFPTKPYNSLRFFSKGGKAEVKNVTLHKLGL